MLRAKSTGEKDMESLSETPGSKVINVDNKIIKDFDKNCGVSLQGIRGNTKE